MPDIDCTHLEEFINTIKEQIDLNSDFDEELSPPIATSKDVKDFKSALKVVRTDDATYIVVVAVHKDEIKNDIVRVSCDRGVPITGYVYDGVNDCYLINCVDCLSLGYVDASFTLESKDTGWIVQLPMPDAVLKRYLNLRQKSDLKQFKKVFEGDDYTFSFLQMTH